jgi:hypothetical protein
MRYSKFTICAVLLLASGACRSTDRNTRQVQADDKTRMELAATQRSHLAAARTTLDSAIESHALASADRARTLEARSIAGLSRDAAVEKHTRVEDTMRRVVTSGTHADVNAARHEFDIATSDRAVEDAQFSLSGKESAYASALVALASEDVKVATANLELVKSRALISLDHANSRQPVTSRLESDLRAAEGNRDVARARSIAVKKEIAVATALLEERKLERSQY